MTAFTAAYLICGDDHGRIGERRARLRALAEAESGAGGVTVLEGEACTGDALVEALQTMTFALGRRFVIADGVQRLKEAEGEAVAAALDEIDPETTTVAFFGREDARARTPAALVDAVKRAGGHIGREDGVKPRELPAWLEEQARSLEVTLEHQGARALVAHVGARPQRLLRELEKLALEHGPGARLGVDEVDAAAAHSAEHKAYEIADALVRRDGAGATRALLELGEQGERPAGLLYGIVRRLRDAHTSPWRSSPGRRRRRSSASCGWPRGRPTGCCQTYARPTRPRSSGRWWPWPTSSWRPGGAAAWARTPRLCARSPARPPEGQRARRRGCGARARRETSCGRRCCGAGRRA